MKVEGIDSVLFMKKISQRLGIKEVHKEEMDWNCPMIDSAKEYLSLLDASSRGTKSKDVGNQKI